MHISQSIVADCSTYSQYLVAPRCWYAIHTRSNFEVRVARELLERGLESYLPAYQEIHQWKDRKQIVTVPLFPGYVFARFDDSSQVRLTVLQTIGVARILGHCGKCEPVPDYELDAVRRLLESKVPCFAHPFLEEGAWVRMRRGPLRGLEGLLVRIKNQTRLIISVTLLSQSLAAEVDASDVLPALRPSGKQGSRCTRI